jgi:hypothetical protein
MAWEHSRRSASNSPSSSYRSSPTMHTPTELSSPRRVVLRFLLLILIPCAAAVPVAIRHPWGLGSIAILLHACVDFPFPRLGIPVWIFAMLALLLPVSSTARSG